MADPTCLVTEPCFCHGTPSGRHKTPSTPVQDTAREAHSTRTKPPGPHRQGRRGTVTILPWKARLGLGRAPSGASGSTTGTLCFTLREGSLASEQPE